MDIDKLICNRTETILSENLESLRILRKETLEAVKGNSNYTLYRRNNGSSRVKIVVSGGASLGPLFSEFVGNGLADGMVHGDFNCAPAAYAIFELGKKISGDRGVLLLSNHFTGDFLNNDMAEELLNDAGIPAKTIYCSDDILSARGEPKANRGGLCGIVFLIKIAAKMAQNGKTLEEIYDLLREVVDRLFSITITISDDQETVFFGEGFSGERAPISEKYSTVDKFVTAAAQLILDDVPERYKNSQSNCYVSVNRFRHLSSLEGNLIARSVYHALSARQLTCKDITVSHIFDVFSRKGCNISILFSDPKIDKFIKQVHGYNFTI